MNGVMFLIAVIIFLAGFGLGWFARSFGKYDGSMIIDNCYENKSTWFLNVDSDVEDIPKRKSLKFKVVVKD